MNKNKNISLLVLGMFIMLFFMLSCKSKKHTQQTNTNTTQVEDTIGKCRLTFKTAKALSKHIKESELVYKWIYAKADVQTMIDGEDHNLDVRIRGRKDSAIWISIQAVGLIDIAKLLITRDSVKMVVYVKKQYFKGDFNYINQLLNADLDFDIIQAALIGNSADFDDDDTKMKPVVDRENCHYLLSTERKRKLRRITSGQDSLKRSLQTMRLNPENFKIINNDFEDVSTNRSFHAKYEKFSAPDSVFAPHDVNIEIRAEKKIDLKINYVRIEINQPQKLTLNIPKNYEPIPIKKRKALAYAYALFSFFGISQLSFSQKSSPSQKELQNKKNKLNDDIKQLNSQLSQTKANKKSQINTIVVINTKIKVREELISTINHELAQINSNIKKNVAEVNALKASLDKLKSEYAKMIYYAQRNQDSYTKIMFLFSAGDFNQAYMRIKYFQQYAAFRKKQAAEIVATQTILNEKLKELEAQRHEKNVLLGNEQEEKQQLDGEKQQQEIVLSELQQQEKELKEELEKKKRDAEQLQVAIKRLIEAEIKRKLEESVKIAAEKQAKAEKAEKNKNKTKTSKTKAEIKTEEAKATAPELTAEAEAVGADFSSSRGKLPWPVTKGVICQPYGEYEHPAIKGFMMNNNGVEICANKGTQARAIFEGEVTSIAISPTGGKLIIIRHGEYLSVYSNIGDVFVKQGDKVTIKQTIGTILDEDGKTSMNLQIWKGQKTMDPSGWLFNAR